MKSARIHAENCFKRKFQGGDIRVLIEAIEELNSDSTEFQFIVAQTIAFSISTNVVFDSIIRLIELSSESKYSSVQGNAVLLIKRLLISDIDKQASEKIEKCLSVLRQGGNSIVLRNLSYSYPSQERTDKNGTPQDKEEKKVGKGHSKESGNNS